MKRGKRIRASDGPVVIVEGDVTWLYFSIV